MCSGLEREILPQEIAKDFTPYSPVLKQGAIEEFQNGALEEASFCDLLRQKPSMPVLRHGEFVE